MLCPATMVVVVAWHGVGWVLLADLLQAYHSILYIPPTSTIHAFLYSHFFGDAFSAFPSPKWEEENLPGCLPTTRWDFFLPKWWREYGGGSSCLYVPFQNWKA